MSIEDYTTDIDMLATEGDRGADYIEELLNIADFGGDLEIDVENNRATVSVIGEDDNDIRDLERLVGEDGEVLEALQELTRLHAQREMGFRSRLMLDIADFRLNKKAELTAIAEEAVTKVKVSGEPVKLEPMNPFERKVCHDVAAAAGFVSESEGQAPQRCVVIQPIEVDSLEEESTAEQVSADDE
ncbi:MAG: R3H domain-containing nucleic acid-binding protein [Actinomycetaceae bacterium]|nr:R3H domain-containing nucleic acid-binding protein [Actinomycetaceae bacterium]